MSESTVNVVKNLDKEQLKKVSKQLATKLAVNITLGVLTAVTVTLISGAILSALTPKDETPAE